MFLKFLLSLFFCLTIFNNKTTVFAQETFENNNFSINLHSTYSVNATGKTLVTQKFSISNNTPEFFITKYGIVVSSTNIENIKITDNGQTLEPQVSKLPGQTSIGVTFTENLVGEDKKRELIISYTDQDIAQISGKILELNIPALADPKQYQQYQLDLIVPSIFGNASRISPSQFTLKQGGDFDTFHYNDLKGQAVSAIFGESQVFDLKLSYHLENPNSQNALTQITLPPETPMQKVHYHHLDPLPKNIKIDQDGNFIATYEIPANNSFNVELLAQILLTLHPNPLVPTATVLPEHLRVQKFWDTNDLDLQKIAATLDSVASINDYVIEKLDYTQMDLQKHFHRLGASTAILPNKQADATCQEFTDLFITLARIKQIPTKRIIGYAYSSNKELKPISVVGDVLHAWPAYYDSNTESWREIDPTWQDTTGGVDYFSKFDLNHIAFAINGVSSSLPYPAGSYLDGEDLAEKKIFVEFSQSDFPIISPELTINLIVQKLSGITIPGKYLLELNNTTGQSWYFTKFDLTAPELLIDCQTSLPTMIAPFQKLKIPINVYNKDGLIGKKSTLNVNIQLQEGQSFSHEQEISGRGQIKIANPKKIIFIGGGFIVAALTAGSLYLLGQTIAKALRQRRQQSENKNQQLHTLSTALSENQTINDQEQNNSSGVD